MPYIYALVSPDAQEIRYVGKTGKSIAKRKAQHVYSSKHGEAGHKAKWIRALIADGKLPEIILLEEVSESEWEEKERYWIEQHNKSGRLTNHQLGGGGGRPKQGQHNHKSKFSAEEVRQAVVLYIMGCSCDQIRTLEPFSQLSEKTLRTWAQKETRAGDTIGIPTKRGYNALSK